MKKAGLLIAIAMIVSVAFASPAGVKENSPPGIAAVMPAVYASHVDAMFEMQSFVEINQEKTFAGVTAEFAIGQEYASHVADADFAPLYRSEITWQPQKLSMPAKGLTKMKLLLRSNQRVAFNPPEPIPKR
jgi:hypothetical protein